MSKDSVGLDVAFVVTRESAESSIDKINGAINKASDYRGYIGSLQNRLEHTLNNLRNTNKNITQAESLIRDTDTAMKMMEYTKQNILV